jgi:shikimate kinase
LAGAISAPGVVATGGGAVLSELSRSRLTATTVVYLSTDGKHIASRIKYGNRPLLKNGLDDWQRIYDARKPIYESVCDFNINTSGQPLNATVAEIREKVGV